MKILFINANQERVPDLVPPIGIAYIAAAARSEGHRCQVFDSSFVKDFAAPLAEKIGAFGPQLIAISMRNVDNVAYPLMVSYLDQYRNIVAVCRETAPTIPMVIGGSAFSLFPEEFFQVLQPDYGIVGEGEELLCQLAASLEKTGKPCANINGLDNDRIYYSSGGATAFYDILPARDLLDVTNYFRQGGSINIQTKRGCCLRCTYCTYPLLEGRTIRKREPATVVDEIEHCLNTYGVDYFFFVDNVFNFPPQHALDICREIIKRKLKIGWTAYVSHLKISEKALAIYKQSGCSSLDFGTDAASTIGLNSLAKAFSIDAIRNNCRWCHQHGIKFSHSLIFGCPGETAQSIEETIDNILQTQPTVVIAIMGIRLYRNTPLTLQLIRQQWITEEQIGIKPVFYIEETVHDYLLQRMKSLSEQYRHWIVPGLGTKINARFLQRLRRRGIKGPIWEIFAELPPA